MRLRSQLVLSHLVSIVVVAVVLGGVNLFIVLRNTREMERLTLDRTLGLAGQVLLNRHRTMQEVANEVGNFVATKGTLDDGVRTLGSLQRLLEVYEVERVEVFRGLEREIEAYRWERGAGTDLDTHWLPQNPRLAAQIVGGRTCTWVQRSPDGTVSLKYSTPVLGDRGGERRWIVVTEPLDAELLERLAPAIPVAGFRQGTRTLSAIPATAGSLDERSLAELVPKPPLSRLFRDVIADRAVLRLDDGSALHIFMMDAPLLSGQTLFVGLRTWFLIVIAALIIAAVLGSGLASRLIAPLRALLEGTSAMARGHLMVRLRSGRKDELGSLTREFNRMADEISSTYMGVISTLAEVVEAKSEYTREHIERVERLTLATADVLERRGIVRFSSHQKFILAVAAILHDVGKISISSEILNKSGPLSTDEREKILTHPEVGAFIVERMGKLEAAAEIIRCAHEHFDGSGYPRGLAGEEIPVESRIILAIDAFDAMTGRRPYSPRRSIPEALAELRAEAGHQFDPTVVDALVEAVTVVGDDDWDKSSDSGLAKLLQPSSDPTAPAVKVSRPSGGRG